MAVAAPGLHGGVAKVRVLSGSAPGGAKFVRPAAPTP